MGVAQLTRFGGQPQVRDGGDGDIGVVGGQGEAVRPRVLGLVLQVQGQGLVLEISETGLGWDLGASNAAGLYLIRLTD